MSETTTRHLAHHDSSQARQLLTQRAQQLAKPQAALTLSTDENRYLLFSRSGGEYAIDTRHVLQVLPVTAHAALPHAPPFNLGLTAARGELLPLFDLAALLGEPARAGTPRLMLLCGRQRAELALAVDEALELVASGELLPPPPGASPLIAGVSSLGFTIIDGSELLSDPRLFIDSAQQENLP